MKLCSCFGARHKAPDPAQQPLLPQYHHDTAREQQLHEKIHTYQMLRALAKGSLPSNEQLIINLRTLQASDLLNPLDSSVSNDGRLLARYIKKFLGFLIEFIKHKNPNDQLQDLVWYLTKSRVGVDTSHIYARASDAKSKANSAAAYQSFRTVGSLLLNNSEFRLFLSDLSLVGREIFQDSALAASKAAEEASHQVGPGTDRIDGAATLSQDTVAPPTKEQLADEASHVSSVAREGAKEVGEEARRSASKHFLGGERQVLLRRLQNVVLKLRQKPEYANSVSTLSLLLRRYVLIYSRTIAETVETLEDDVHTNKELDAALYDLASLFKNFGDPLEWQTLQQNFERVIQHQRTSLEFESLMSEASEAIQAMLTDPSFYDDPERQFHPFQNISRSSEHEPSFHEDVQNCLRQVQRTFASVVDDEYVAEFSSIAHKILDILSPTNSTINSDLLRDVLNTFGPVFVKAIQYLPIPRLELAIPELDLLLENLILEPGHTVYHSSFLPFRFRTQTYNSVELRKTVTGTVSHTTSLVTVKLDGFSCRADDLGYWLRMHKGIFHFADEGIASFHLDKRGIDIHMDVEVGKNHLEQILSLRAVRVHIHNFTYQLRKSKFAWLPRLFKPLVKPFVRKTIERQLAAAIADFFHAANRELVFARERLRATQIANPQELTTYIKALAARLRPADNSDVYVRVGAQQPDTGLFRGVHTPGSLAKIWEQEAERVDERIEDFERGGWRNDIFDVKAVAVNADDRD